VYKVKGTRNSYHQKHLPSAVFYGLIIPMSQLLLLPQELSIAEREGTGGRWEERRKSREETGGNATDIICPSPRLP